MRHTEGITWEGMWRRQPSSPADSMIVGERPGRKWCRFLWQSWQTNIGTHFYFEQAPPTSTKLEVSSFLVVFRTPPVLHFAASLEDLRRQERQETVYSKLLLEGLDEDGRADTVMLQAVCL